ncbi:retrovirus-related pol polyprotein from transposon TNT 1-94 [Tanacetum coccineum]
MINMCLTGKTVGYDRPRHLMLQILWGIIHRSNIDYAKRIWEEFVQSIQTFLTDKKNLTTAAREKKKSTPLLIPSIRFTKLIIHYLKTKHNIHPKTNSPLHYSHNEIILGTLRSVGKDCREIFREEGVTKTPKATKVTKPKASKQTKPSAPKAAKVMKPADDKEHKQTSSQPPKSTPGPTEPSKKDQGKKRKPVKETSDAPSPAKHSRVGKVTKKRMPKGNLQLVDEFFDEGVSEKEHVYGDEEANLQRALELSLKDQGERTQGPACPVVFKEPNSGRFQPLLETPKEKSPAKQFIFQRRTLMPTEPSRIVDSPSLDAVLAPTDSETEFDEEVPGINAEDQDEGQVGPNPGVQDKGQARSNPGDAIESQPQSGHVVHAGPNLEHTDLEATDASTQQKTEQMDEEFTTTAYPNELSFTNQFLKEKPQEYEPEKPILNQSNLALEERLDKHGTRLYNLENLNIPRKVRKAVDEIVTNAVDWAMQAPLRARFSDLPAIDMKEVLQQWMFEDKSYLAHEDHKNLFEALEKKKRKKRASLRTPSGSPPSQPPPLPPPAGASGALDSLMNEDSILEEHASALVSTYEPPAENSLLAKIGDMMTFMNGYCSKVNKIVLTQADFKGQAYENSEGDQVRIDVNRPLPHGGPPGHDTNQTQFFFNKDLDYLRYGNKGSRPALSIFKMKAARYPDFGLELLVLEQMWIDKVCTYDISDAYGIYHWWFNRQKFYIERHDSPSRRREVKNHMRIVSVVSIKAYLWRSL